MTTKQDKLAEEQEAWMGHVLGLSRLHRPEDCIGYACKICKALTQLSFESPINRQREAALKEESE